MGKRGIILLAACILAFVGGKTDTVYAAAVKSPYMAEQAQGKAPNVRIYMTGSQMNNAAEVTGSVGEINFTKHGDIVSFEESGEKIRYIILMDNSGSVNENQFEEAKKQLMKLRKSLTDGDEMFLYTVGTKSAAGEKKQVFGRTENAAAEKEAAADCNKIKKIQYMNTADSKTVLYRSLNEVLAEQASPKIRTVVLLITDGEDDSKGKDIDKVSTEKEVQNASVPVYGIILDGYAAGEGQKISYTKNKILAEKTCRGYYYDCSTDASVKSVKKAFTTINQLLQKETYVVNLTAPTNKAVGREQLKLVVNGTAANRVLLDYSDYEKEENAPAIAGDIETAGGNSITFTLQDEYGVNTGDVKEASHYTIQSKKDGGKGKAWAIESVKAVSEGSSVTVTLTAAEEFYTDDYVLTCKGIRDISQDENMMDATAEFSVTDGKNARTEAVKRVVKSYWWIGLFLLVLIIGGILIRVIRKKAVKVVEVNPDDLVKADRKLIRLTITDRSGAIKDVEWDVEGSLFVGRSNICNIYFDDDRLSKQHFVVEVNKMGCYIEDLESTNGTFVNGVKMTNRRMLLDGDVITAGREKIVFHIPKNQSPVDSEIGER